MVIFFMIDWYIAGSSNLNFRHILRIVRSIPKPSKQVCKKPTYGVPIVCVVHTRHGLRRHRLRPGFLLPCECTDLSLNSR